jgi:hypothetical protein
MATRNPRKMDTALAEGLIASLRALLSLLLLVACASPKVPLRDFMYYYPQRVYSIVPTRTTPKGIHVDGNEINLSRIDRLFDGVETCLQTHFPQGKIPESTQAAASCNGGTIPFPLARDRITVKIAQNWRLNAAKTQQLLPFEAGTGCTEKGEVPPCYWRAMISDSPLALIVPPSMYLLPDVLVRVSTGCLNPWADPGLSACAMPRTGPLDDGTKE